MEKTGKNKIAFDTSVLISAMIESHPAHNRCVTYLKQVYSGSMRGTISAHCLAEIYSVLTTLPLNPKVSPFEAEIILQKNIYAKFDIIALTVADYKNSIQRVAGLYQSGGILYDALHIEAAIKSKSSQLVTLNQKHFQKLAPANLQVLAV